ncbi:MAG: hypothetical protein LBS19_11695 [Clostridiales bacterium]|jgi:hypothetical protein|nr:hypothetical protein [Clostridiales bacterium]
MMKNWMKKARILAAINALLIVLGCFGGYLATGSGEARSLEWEAEAVTASQDQAVSTLKDTLIIYELYDGYGYLFYRDASPAGEPLAGLTITEFKEVMPNWSIVSFGADEVRLIKVIQ